MSQVLNRKFARDLYFCERGVNVFISRSGIKLGRGITPEQFAQKWALLEPAFRAELYAEYRSYLRIVAKHLGTSVEDWLGQSEMANPFVGIVLGAPVGKPKYVSGKTAYEQRFGCGTLCVSYRTAVGFRALDGKTYRTVARYSVTTTKHMSRFRLYNSVPVTEQQLRTLANSASSWSY